MSADQRNERGEILMNVMTPCPPDSNLMKAWKAYEETEDFKNSLYWATTETLTRQERATELNIPPEANIASPQDRAQYAKGSLWAAFMTGFAAAGSEAADALADLLKAGSDLLADVRRRYPGEELRCPYMRALDEAVKRAESASKDKSQ